MQWLKSRRTRYRRMLNVAESKENIGDAVKDTENYYLPQIAEKEKILKGFEASGNPEDAEMVRKEIAALNNSYKAIIKGLSKKRY